MSYRIWSESEKEEFTKKNNEDVVKASIEAALAIAASAVAIKYAGSLPIEDITCRVAAVAGSLGLIGFDMHACMNFCMHMMEGERIESGYTALYDKNDIGGKKR